MTAPPILSKPSLDRQRGGVAFVERWTNARAGVIGFLTGRGNSSPAIAELLDDGTDPATVRRMWGLWHFDAFGHDAGAPVVTVPLSTRDRAHLTAAAMNVGMSLEAYCEMVLVGSIKR